MTSNWALPTTISQYAEDGADNVHVSWHEVDSFYSLKFPDGRSTRTSRELVHLARDPKHDIKEKTYYLKLTNFNFQNIPEQVLGIEMKLSMKRSGRITDETIQLSLNDELIGENQASLDLDLTKIYGSDTSLWDTTLTKQDLEDPSFGVILRFQSHPRWPHKSSPLIDSVELRVY